MSINGLYLKSDECKYNGRTKYRLDDNGVLIPYETLYCTRFIFNPEGVKTAELSKAIQWRLDYEEANAELFGGELPKSGKYKSEPDPKGNLERSKRRAAGKLHDYIMCNDFDTFVTLTLDEKEIDRSDYSVIIKRLNTYLDNRVRRNGLRYVGVPELHKRGGFHFHFLCNSDALKLVDSGTVSVPGCKRPIKVTTADRKGVPLSDRQTVYNISDWSLGFSTAILTYGERGAIARYVGKYITKGEQKLGGRWYYSGGELKKPLISYERGGFDNLTDYTYEFDCEGGKFKVVKYDDKGGVLHG